ncbi:ankyrin repeat and KH domain-containing protein mask-like isoform X2 [Acanthaster planci]|uniref:Ankyrin repeat and KH domain-containing protein mask-like isoform X2 n=1 Tax=Acanthaster planci TaxID=133434 RepID=A0A8B7YCQ8_ACAPL|nr:ankyrin repeat and KH domain-containing protein mask-like isoform X2 [Acanthaster planci]
MQNGGQKKVPVVRKDGKISESPKAAVTALEHRLDKAQLLAFQAQDLISDLSGSEEGEVSEVESFILNQDELQFDSSGNPDLRAVDPETLEALLEAAGIDKLTTADGKAFTDPEILGKLTSSVSSALDEAEAALYRMRSESAGNQASQGADGQAYADAEDDPAALKSINETTEEGESLLSLACSGGYFELAQVLLKMNANVEDRGSKGDCTPLMEAASAGHVDIVKLLIDYGADVNAQSSAGNTPLMYACSGGHEDAVKVLLDHGANIEDHNENGHTPLMEAASSGHVGIAKVLLERGAGINTHSNEFKESALTLACYKGHLEMVQFLLEAGADHEHKTDEMHTALMEASMDGHVEVARLLLDHGAQVNMPADSFESPLTLAACGGHTKLAALLIERGANIEEVNDEGYTPLMEAAREGHEEMVALLLAQGANINAQTEETQETALTLACCGGFLDVAKFLIEVGADIELGCSTPLMEAAQEGHVELVKFLLSKNANVRAVTATGDTALTYACENGHTDVADVLLAAWADLEHESEGGRTPLMKAARAGHICTVQYLISKGAEVNRATTNNDHTVLSLACAGGHLRVVELLLEHAANPSHKLKDNSTCLIEAAKGGHSGVMSLILNYPSNLMTTSAPAEGTVTPPTPEQGEVSRVPTQALPIVVPPQKPDKHPDEMPQPQGSLLLAQANVDPSVAQRDPTHQRIPNTASLSNESDADVSASGLGQKPHPDVQMAKEQLLEKKQKQFRELQKIEWDFIQKDVGAAADSTTTTANGESTVDRVPSPSDMPSADVASRLAAEANNNKSPKGVREAVPGSPNAEVLAADIDDSALDLREIKLNQVNKEAPALSPDLPQPRLSFQGTEAESQMPTQDLPAASRSPGSPLPGQTVIASSRDPQDGHSHKLEVSTNQQSPASHQTAAPLTKDASSQMAPLTSASLPDVQSLLPIGEDAPTVSVTAVVTGYTNLGVGRLVDVTSQPRESGVGEESQNGLMVASSVCPLAETTDAQARPELPPKPWKAPPQTQSVGTQCDSSSLTCRVSSPLTLSTTPAAVPTPDTAVHPHQSPSSPGGVLYAPRFTPHPPVEVDAQTESNHDTALTVACAGGHDELVQMLLEKNANMEHKDKKGFTPLILAATAGHCKTVEILLDHGCDIEAQSERTKDTPLSLACSGGRYEVVDLLLSRSANKEHRNVSDYTPLSLAASGGFVSIIKLLLRYGAEINSRTGSKLGISPLMLAAMNGHTAAVKLLLDMGSDINAQIETNRNTALTLACFQGRTEVVSLLVDRKANVEHRAKTGLTPLMEAASGGYADVGAVLIEKGADVNAGPVPSSRDTALTIAADKGHYRFVELLLEHMAAVDVKNKKGNSPLWLACNGGHLDVVQRLVHAGADIDSQDNRKVSCLMAAFRKGHVKVVRWMVRHVNQFPSDAECMRYISTISDKELLKKCHQCMEIIVAAKDRQAAEANKNATNLLEELESEKSREESRKAQAAKRREKKKKKRREKQQKDITDDPDPDADQDQEREDSTPSPTINMEDPVPLEPPSATTTTTIGKVCTTDTPATYTMSGAKKGKNTKLVTSNNSSNNSSNVSSNTGNINNSSSGSNAVKALSMTGNSAKITAGNIPTSSSSSKESVTSASDSRKDRVRSRAKSRGQDINEGDSRKRLRNSVIEMDETDSKEGGGPAKKERERDKGRDKERRKKSGKDGKHTDHSSDHSHSTKNSPRGGSGDAAGSSTVKNPPGTGASPKRGQKRDEGWKEVVRRSISSFRSKKVNVPASAISRLIGRGGCNINAIREVTGAHIDVDRQNKGGERTINIKGSADATRQAHQLIAALIKDPDRDIADIIPKVKKVTSSHQSSSNTATFTVSNSYSATKTVTTASSAVKVSVKSTTADTKGMNLWIPQSGAVRPSLSIANSVAHHAQFSQAVFAKALQQPLQFRGPGAPLAQFQGGFPLPQAASTISGWGAIPVRNVVPMTGAPRRPSPSQSGPRFPTATTTATGGSPSAGSVAISSSVGSSPRSAARQLFPPTSSTAGPTPQATSTDHQAMAAPPRSSSSTAPSSSASFASKIADSKMANVRPLILTTVASLSQPAVTAPPTKASVIVRPSQPRQPNPTQPSYQQVHQQQPPPQQPLPQQQQQMSQGTRAVTPSSSSTNTTSSQSYPNFNFLTQSHSTGFWGTGVTQHSGRPDANGEYRPPTPPSVEMSKAPGYNRSSHMNPTPPLQQPPTSIPNPYFNAHNYPVPNPPNSTFPPGQQFGVNINQTLPPEQPDYPSPIGSTLNANARQFTPIANPNPSPTPPNTMMSSSSSPISPGASPRSATTTPSPVTMATDQPQPPPPAVIGPDRRLPIPIGNERSRGQRKTPVNYVGVPVSDLGNPVGTPGSSIWAYTPGSGGDWAPSTNLEDLPGAPANGMPNFPHEAPPREDGFQMHMTPVSPFGEQHEPMAGMHHNMAMGDMGGVTGHGMAEAVWNPAPTMHLDGTNPKVWGAWSQSAM